ncbi:Uncharacterised protein [Chlamydia trachomatis]|nr:Uncharacterised protein [Chlamydia trachomatis]
MGGTYPVDSSLHLTISIRHSRFALWVVCSIDLHYLAMLILLAASTLNNICAPQTYLLARGETEVLLWRLLHKVLTLYPKLTTKSDPMVLGGLRLRIIQYL